MNIRRLIALVVALLVFTALASVAYANLKPGTKAPNFTLNTLQGKSFTLSTCFNKPQKVVVLDIWATWCPPCRAEIPYLVNISDKYKGKAAVVGVAIDEEKSTVANFAKEHKMNYTIALDPNAAKTGSAYEVRGIPVTYIIDKKGVIRYVHSGFPRTAEEQKKEAAKIEKEIQTLLNE